MSESPSARSLSRRRKRNARLVMLSALTGALLVLVISTILWPGDEGGPGGGGSAKRTPGAVPPPVFNAMAGTCLNWNEADAKDIAQVNCDQPHLFEVTGKSDLKADFGDRAPFPSNEQWQQLKQRRCSQVAGSFIHFDPKGRFAVGAFTPSEDGWAHGDRTLHCGLQQPGPSGKLYRMAGAASQVDQSNTYSLGRCLGINGTEVWDPVDCGRPHAVEITGLVNLGEQFKNGFPKESEQDGYLATRCAELTAIYGGSATAAQERGLITYWDTLQDGSWAAGSRRVNCKVSAQLPDGSALAPVTGSIKGKVQVSKQPAPKDAAPAQPGVPATGER